MDPHENRDLHEKGLPELPSALTNCAFIDKTSMTAYCIEDTEKELLREFRNHLSLLKQGGFVEGFKYIPAEKFAMLKLESSNQHEPDNSEMQSMAVKLFKAAAQRDASDIHIVDHGSYGQVHFRINGDLLPMRQLPKEITVCLLQAIYTSMTDIKEPTYKDSQPQSARIKKRQFLPENVHSIRIEKTPLVDGQLMVFRFLYDNDFIPLENLGYSERLGQLDAIRLMQKRPRGLIIIAGTTGSGKSTSLKNILTNMKAEAPTQNYITIEDPPEYPMEGINQIPILVDAKASEDEREHKTTRALDSILRLDPDLIMIGEIRSKTWAELGIKSARTGHQTWATIHAGDPFGIIARLIEILDTPNALNRVADVGILSGLIFQELVQTLCPHCKMPLTGNEDKVPVGVLKRLMNHVSLDENPKISIKGPGCEKCYQTGIGGRELLAETVVPDHYIIEKILTEGLGSARRTWLDQNPNQSIKHHALEKIKMGVVDPAIAEKVVGPLTLDDAMKDKILNRIEIHELSA